ncbi:MAG TPA: hypothetical protein VFZ59_00830 [Verrucomicrobiae bacterium]|nr:hypothetical protein [Verrucomicrobiae bacterium]
MTSRVKALLFSWAVCFAVAFGVGKAATFSTTPIADAYVATGPSGELSANNYGGGGALGLAAPNLPLGEFQTVIKFGLSNVRNAFDAQFGVGLWSVQSVTLQLTASSHGDVIYNEIGPGQFNISLLQNNSWMEGTGRASAPTSDGITFNSLQSAYINNTTDEPLGTFSFGGASSGDDSYDLTLSPTLITHLLAGGDLSLRLYAADDSVSYLFSSRATGTVANRPTLIINAVPEPGGVALTVTGLAALFSVGRRIRQK